jgi:hypothetical protein
MDVALPLRELHCSHARMDSGSCDIDVWVRQTSDHLHGRDSGTRKIGLIALAAPVQ